MKTIEDLKAEWEEAKYKDKVGQEMHVAIFCEEHMDKLLALASVAAFEASLYRGSITSERLQKVIDDLLGEKRED